MTETRERTEKNQTMLPQLFANGITCLIQFWEVFQVVSPHVNHIEDKNEFKETKDPAAKTSKDKNPTNSQKETKQVFSDFINIKTTSTKRQKHIKGRKHV